MNTSVIDYSDVQGLVRFGHGHLPEACFLLLRIEDAPAVRAWLAALAITTAEKLADLPPAALQVAFTSEGLRALGVPAAIIRGFSREFISGMSGDDTRSRRLGDVGANAPVHWQWGGPGNVPHVLLMLYSLSGKLDECKQPMMGPLTGSGLSLLNCLDTLERDGNEPFGFKDGISQPQIDWDLERKPESVDQLAYSNILALGEFLLGYPNEYGHYTDRPLVNVNDDPHCALLPVAAQPNMHDLGRNGTYLVFRHLQQDVQGFWQFLDAQTNADPTARQALAEAMVGRTMTGEPLVPSTDRAIPGVGPKADDIRLNQFTFASDSAGIRCPFGAHVRRANPRNADLPERTRGVIARLAQILGLGRLVRMLGFGRENFRTDTVASVRFHRLLRRARKYGPRLTLAEAIQRSHPDGEERGLHFLCLNANIERQFEFVQNAWIMNSKFNGLTEESSPLLGNREPIAGDPVTNSFSLPQAHGFRRCLPGVPQFVTVRGGAYFFVPGIRALRYLASLSG